MKNKTTTIYVAVLSLLLTFLFALSLRAGLAGYANLLLVMPHTLGTPGLNTDKLEEFSEEEFLLTYAIRQAATVQAINSRHSATLVGTNHNYAGMMGYLPLDGGFFTKAAMDSNNKHMVLNETAAFQMFGSSRIAGSTLKVNGETWIITGVIQDNDTENANLYVPAGVTGGRADSIMVLMDKTVTEAYIKNTLKSIGIHDNSYDFINLSMSAKAFEERFAVAWKAALSAATLLFILTTGKKLLKTLRFYRDRTRELYFRELIARYRKDFTKTVGEILSFAAGIAVTLVLSLQILETCLAWQELTPITGELTAGNFGQKLLWLREYTIFDNVLFWTCVCIILLGLVFVLFRRADRMGKSEALMLNGESELA